MVEAAVRYLPAHPAFAGERMAFDRDETHGVPEDAVEAGTFAGIDMAWGSDLIVCEGNDVPRRCRVSGDADAVVGSQGFAVGDSSGHVDSAPQAMSGE